MTEIHERPDFEGDTTFEQFGPAAPTVLEEEGDHFPPQIEQDLIGLTFLGALTSDFELWGHEFSMRTLKAGEELAVTQMIKEYEDTLGQAKALGIAFVAASLITVDGRRLAQPLGPGDTVEWVRIRFNHLRDWYWPVIESLYNEYAELLLRQAEVFQALEGKSTASRVTS